MNVLKTEEKGLGIVAAILIMLVVAVMGVTLASLLGTNAQSSVNYMQSQQAFFLAESGIQKALLALDKYSTQATWTGGGWSGTYPAGPMTFQGTLTGYGDYDVSIATPAGTSPHITATGYIPSRAALVKAVRVVDIYTSKTNLFGQYAAFGGGSGGGSSIGVDLSGLAYTDSYDSSIGLYNVGGNIGLDGDVGTNADIRTVGGAIIGGDAITGPLGTYDNDPAVTGSISHDGSVTLPPVVVPSALTSLSSSGNIKGTASIASGNYKYDYFSLGSSEKITITGPANIYITGSNSIKLTGSAEIIVSAASTGPVVIYVDGDVNAAGQGITNSTFLPSNFQLYGSKSTPTQDIKLSGGSQFFGAVYAPNGALNISGIADLYGSFIGDTMNMTGGGALHHDGALSTMSSLPSFMPGTWKPENWKEVY
jgi:hypothetical protein